MHELRLLTHISMHVLAPGLLACLLFRSVWKKAWLLMLLTMLVDLDHLLAHPIYDAHRNSIGFHPLHTLPAIICYAILLLPKQTRIIACGLLLHMLTDALDSCWL